MTRIDHTIGTPSYQRLRGILLDSAEMLDPDHQGSHWPDPIAWDVRPLIEQASDLMVLLDVEAEQGREWDPGREALLDARDHLRRLVE